MFQAACSFVGLDQMLFTTTTSQSEYSARALVSLMLHKTLERLQGTAMLDKFVCFRALVELESARGEIELAMWRSLEVGDSLAFRVSTVSTLEKPPWHALLRVQSLDLCPQHHEVGLTALVDLNFVAPGFVSAPEMQSALLSDRCCTRQNLNRYTCDERMVPPRFQFTIRRVAAAVGCVSSMAHPRFKHSRGGISNPTRSVRAHSLDGVVIEVKEFFQTFSPQDQYTQSILLSPLPTLLMRRRRATATCESLIEHLPRDIVELVLISSFPPRPRLLLPTDFRAPASNRVRSFRGPGARSCDTARGFHAAHHARRARFEHLLLADGVAPILVSARLSSRSERVSDDRGSPRI